MAQLKIFSEIADNDEKLFLKGWGKDAVSYTDIEDFVGKIPEDDKRIDL